MSLFIIYFNAKGTEQYASIILLMAQIKFKSFDQLKMKDKGVK